MFLADSLAVVVYESVIEVFPDDPTINSELLQICNEFKGEWIENIKEQIFKVAVDKFDGNPLANLQSSFEMRSLNKTAFENDDEDTLFGKVNKVFEDIHDYFKALETKEKTKEKLIKEKSTVIEELIKRVISYYQQLASERNERKDVFLAVISTILKNTHLNQISNDKLINILESII